MKAWIRRFTSASLPSSSSLPPASSALLGPTGLLCHLIMGSRQPFGQSWRAPFPPVVVGGDKEGAVPAYNYICLCFLASLSFSLLPSPFLCLILDRVGLHMSAGRCTGVWVWSAGQVADDRSLLSVWLPIHTCRHMFRSRSTRQVVDGQSLLITHTR